METKKYRVKTHKTNDKLVRRYLYIYSRMMMSESSVIGETSGLCRLRLRLWLRLGVLFKEFAPYQG